MLQIDGILLLLVQINDLKCSGRAPVEHDCYIFDRRAVRDMLVDHGEAFILLYQVPSLSIVLRISIMK